MSIADLVYLQSLAKKQASDEAYYDYVFQRAYANKIANGWYDTIAQGANQVAAAGRNMYDSARRRFGRAVDNATRDARTIYKAGRKGAQALWNSPLGTGVRDTGNLIGGTASTIGRNAIDAANAWGETVGQLGRSAYRNAATAVGEAGLAARRFGRNVGRAFDAASNQSANTFRGIYNKIQNADNIINAHYNHKPGVLERLLGYQNRFKHAFGPAANQFVSTFRDVYNQR